MYVCWTAISHAHRTSTLSVLRSSQTDHLCGHDRVYILLFVELRVQFFNNFQHIYIIDWAWSRRSAGKLIQIFAPATASEVSCPKRCVELLPTTARQPDTADRYFDVQWQLRQRQPTIIASRPTSLPVRFRLLNRRSPAPAASTRKVSLYRARNRWLDKLCLDTNGRIEYCRSLWSWRGIIYSVSCRLCQLFNKRIWWLWRMVVDWNDAMALVGLAELINVFH